MDDRVLGTPVDMPRYSPTDCVRLRDEMTRAREQLFGWMRDQLRLPRPPTIEEEPAAAATSAGTSQVVIQTRAALGWGGMASATGDVAGVKEGGEDDMAGIPEAGRGGR